MTTVYLVCVCVYLFWKFGELGSLSHSKILIWVKKVWLEAQRLISLYRLFSSIQFSRSVMSFYDPMDCSAPGLPVHHQLLELTLTHVHRVGDAIQPSPPLLSPSPPLSSPFPPAFNLSQHQGLFQWVSTLHQVAKILEFQLQLQSFQWIFRTDLL